MKNLRKPTEGVQLHFSMPYERKQLSTAILQSGSGYQRKVQTHVVRRIV